MANEPMPDCVRYFYFGDRDYARIRAKVGNAIKSSISEEKHIEYMKRRSFSAKNFLRGRETLETIANDDAVEELWSEISSSETYLMAPNPEEYAKLLKVIDDLRIFGSGIWDDWKHEVEHWREAKNLGFDPKLGLYFLRDRYGRLGYQAFSTQGIPENESYWFARIATRRITRAPSALSQGDIADLQ